MFDVERYRAYTMSGMAILNLSERYRGGYQPMHRDTRMSRQTRSTGVDRRADGPHSGGHWTLDTIHHTARPSENCELLSHGQHNF